MGRSRVVYPPPGGGSAVSDASSTVKGITKLSTDPASPTDPIALGANATGRGQFPVSLDGSTLALHRYATPADLKPATAGTFDDEFNPSPTLTNSFPAYPGSGVSVPQNYIVTNGSNAYVSCNAGTTGGTAPTGTGLTTDSGVTWLYVAASANACQVNNWTMNGAGSLATGTDLLASQSSGTFKLDHNSLPGWWRIQAAQSLALRAWQYGTIPTNGEFVLQLRTSTTTPRILLGIEDNDGTNFVLMDVNNSVAGQVRYLKNGSTLTGSTYGSSGHLPQFDRFIISKRGTAYYFWVGNSSGRDYVGTQSNSATMTRVFWGLDQPSGGNPAGQLVDVGFLRSTATTDAL